MAIVFFTLLYKVYYTECVWDIGQAAKDSTIIQIILLNEMYIMSINSRYRNKFENKIVEEYTRNVIKCY